MSHARRLEIRDVSVHIYLFIECASMTTPVSTADLPILLEYQTDQPSLQNSIKTYRPTASATHSSHDNLQSPGNFTPGSGRISTGTHSLFLRVCGPRV